MKVPSKKKDVQEVRKPNVENTEPEKNRLTDDELESVAGGVAPIIKPPPKP